MCCIFIQAATIIFLHKKTDADLSLNNDTTTVFFNDICIISKVSFKSDEGVMTYTKL